MGVKIDESKWDRIIRRRDALKILHDTPGATVSTFDRGRYNWTGREADYIGRQVPRIERVLAVFVERRQDRNGPYALVRSVVAGGRQFTTNRIPD